ncbi:cytochrome P450 monooxygenase [Paraphaeosphaeria sporulosa]|uniref:Cytochrome P450 monooxygenase n=1 Tax=Paraphaeosphaeria sporulosa TaxID=1460663 RepID=A0A177CQM5_9PLEO|nr:cytochrome P450 monooxygenase [Paraphaeosphaeria sporulosa]OAG09824.1 cytochrome P450 monooxygenase [Paraphaeosphaeria sporulosa]
MYTVAVAIVTSTAYFVWLIWIHPLSHFPGPKRAIASNLYWAKQFTSGHSHQSVRSLHDKYGDVVRWGPNELSFACVDAWKDIYDRRKDGKVLIKDPVFYRKDETLRAEHIVNAEDPERHAEIRKMMSYAFSAKALLQQEDLILQYASELREAIREKGADGPINLVNFFNWTTFDILGELAFGEPFGSLKNRKTDSWIAIILDHMQSMAWDAAIWKFPLLHYFQSWLTPKAVREGGARHALESKKKILRREREGPKSDRIDFVSYILKKRDELLITDWQLAAHSNALIIAGSETSATVLSGLFYYLCKHPDVYAKLKDELRSHFSNANDITAKAAGELPYLTACISETFRIYPPIPIAMPRVTPEGGCTIAGHFVPAGTVVGVHAWSITHNPKYFRDPDSFRPERWIEKIDNLEASKPFLTGPRMCMGINMAWIEVRIIAAQLVYMFDFELDDNNFDWAREQLCYVLWDKPELFVKAKVFSR